MTNYADRRLWSKILVPETLDSMLRLVANARGYDPKDDLYLFLLDILNTSHPEEVDKLVQFFPKEEWLWEHLKKKPPQQQ